jgi:hypothetical protein
MRALVLAILAGLVSTLVVAAEPLRYENPALHYSLTVPDGWVRMPDDVLASRGKEGGGPSDAPAPVAAFQQPADSWFHVPALVITHLPDKGRRPKDIFEELAREGGLGRNGKSISHDDQRGFVTVYERMPSSDGGEIERVAVFKPGTLGTLHLDFYLPKGDLPAYGDQAVLQVLKSVRFEDGFAVNDLAPGERAPLIEEVTSFLRTRPTTGLMFVLGVVLLATSILTARRKRKG